MMRLRAALISFSAVFAVSSASFAQPADGTGADASGSPAPTSTPSTGATSEEGAVEEPATPGNPVQYGVGFRLRNVRIPKAELELFVERAGNGASNLGMGIDFIRRRGNLELQLGFEYERLTVGNGVWIEKGANVATGSEADYILDPERSGEQFGWFTIEFTFLNHAKINDQFSIRYGGGAGLGIIVGDLERYDVQCVGATNEMPEPGCIPAGIGDGRGVATGPVKYDMPPVFPVVNAILGVQFKPNDSVTINLEGGLRTLLFFGISGAYFF